VDIPVQQEGDQIADGGPGRPWVLDLPDRVLLVAAYWRTIRPCAGSARCWVSHSAVHRVIDSPRPLTTQSV
jgi:hypothetical protein